MNKNFISHMKSKVLPNKKLRFDSNYIEFLHTLKNVDINQYSMFISDGHAVEFARMNMKEIYRFVKSKAKKMDMCPLEMIRLGYRVHTISNAIKVKGFEIASVIHDDVDESELDDRTEREILIYMTYLALQEFATCDIPIEEKVI